MTAILLSAWLLLGPFAAPAHDVNAPVTRTGYISWASPSLGSRYLAVLAPRGTLVRVCAKTCVTLPSTDVGPSNRIRPARIADLALGLWTKVCGLEASAGICYGSVTLNPGVEPPSTDTSQEGTDGYR